MKQAIAVLGLLLVLLVIGVLYTPKAAIAPDQSSITVAGGAFTFSYPPDFGLAVKPEQIAPKSYIPPCDEQFDYCIYYNGGKYAKSTFESAGVRIKERKDLSGAACLATPPEGREDMKPLSTREEENYSASLFAPLGDAATGHLSSGLIFRLSYQGKCYEFERRVGESSIFNYPQGSIKEFTNTERNALEARLDAILQGVTLEPTKEHPFQ